MIKAQMGAVMGVVTLASLFFAPLGGRLSDKIECRWVIGCGAVIVADAGAFVLLQEAPLVLCMFFLGAGFAVFVATMPKVLSMRFAPQDLAKVYGICFSAIKLGAAIAMGTASKFMSPTFNGWRATTVVLAGISLLMGILWLFFYRCRRTVTNTQKDKKVLNSFKQTLKIKEIWSIGLYYGLVMTALTAIIGLFPITIQEKGVLRSGELVSILLGASAIFNIVGGIVSDKIGKRKPFLNVCSILFGLCIPAFIMFRGVPLVILLVIAGAGVGATAPIVMTVLIEIEQISRSLAGSALGFILMSANAGSFVGPIIAGRIMDKLGSSWAGLIFMSVAVVSAAIIVVRSSIN